MHLIITNPILEDYIEYHNLISEEEIQKEFLNFRNQSLDETKSEIEYWVNNKDEAFPSFMRMIKLTNDDKTNTWNTENSILIGFINNTEAGFTDFSRSGFKMLLNFAVSKKYNGYGIMTEAMKLTLERMYEFEYNITSAYVKPGNIGSERVLIKNGFDLVRDDIFGKTFVRPLKIDLNLYKESFNL